jgi:hypothetical protein
MMSRQKESNWRSWGGRGLTDEAIHGGARRAGGSGGEGPEGWSGRSWKGHRGASARGGARGGDGRAEGWPEGAVLGGQRCSGQRWHDVRRSRGGA